MGAFDLPMTKGYVVRWICGWRKPMNGNPQKPIWDDFHTTSLEAAKAKKAELEKNGFEEVKLNECIY